MKKQFKKAISWIKKQPIKGCITGSALLEIFNEPGQDLDVFIYDEKSFTKLLFAMHHSDKFHILDPLEQWKFDRYINKNERNFQKHGLVTIKFNYNTCIPVNIILKRNCENMFSVLSTFDMDIIARGYDIQTKRFLDLSENNGSRVATWNKWNPVFYSGEIWEISRILRQLERCFKYYRRGYNTDALVSKYILLIEEVQKFQNIFNSDNFDEKLATTKANTKIMKKVCEHWLENHTITEEQLELLRSKMKEI